MTLKVKATIKHEAQEFGPIIDEANRLDRRNDVNL